jgi:hypothetical protein
MSEDTVSIPGVTAIADSGFVLICNVNGKVIGVPPSRLARESQVRKEGDCGTLVIPRQMADDLGLL